MLNSFRGWFGEKITAFNMWLFLDGGTYRRFHDVYIPTFSGSAQIDHLLISPFGVFIIETKNYKGWIFGDECAPQWTQTLFGKKYRFQNPLRQTYRQKKALAEYLNINERFINAVVYFAGDSEFKTCLPDNVLDCGLSSYIRRFRQVVFSPAELNGLLAQLNRHQQNSVTTRREHVDDLHARHDSVTTCPKCGSPLVERTARTGFNAGNTFMGCSRFPKCRFIKNC